MLTKDQKEWLVSYEAATHNTNWTGIWMLDQSGNIAYIKMGDLVFMSFPTVVSGATSSGIISSVTALPASIRPTTEDQQAFSVKDDGLDGQGEIHVKTNGIIDILAYPGSPGDFIGSGDSGFRKCSIVYSLS